jgi:hypothetical protein
MTPPSPDPASRHAHETTDVSPLYVGLFAAALVLMIALVLPFLHWVFWRFEAIAERSDPAQSPLAGDQTPPAPQLQADPETDLVKMRSEENQALSSYGWIDRSQRVIRVPIDRAIDILAKRGFPEPEGPPKPPAKEESTP